jgi:mRNA-degrading endonuclease RelE of RelBE toxin-antitoxin system
VIPGTSGLRKLRWALEGRGKRGGSRVIYYYHRPELEVLLLTAYAKNEQEDLSASDKKLLAALVKDIIG